jgi:hypothetical protein
MRQSAQFAAGMEELKIARKASLALDLDGTFKVVPPTRASVTFQGQ